MVLRNPIYTVGWPRGEAAACKAVYTGSNPVPTSVKTLVSGLGRMQGAIGAAVARFPDTEEVTGSNPVSPTKKMVRSAHRAGRTIVVSAVGPLYSPLSEPRERVLP